MNQPIPPDGFRLLTDEEKTRPLPMDALVRTMNTWERSVYPGEVVPRRLQANTYATAIQPAPSPETPTMEAPSVRHYDLERKLTTAEKERDEARAELDIERKVLASETVRFLQALSAKQLLETELTAERSRREAAGRDSEAFKSQLRLCEEHAGTMAEDFDKSVAVLRTELAAVKAKLEAEQLRYKELMLELEHCPTCVKLQSSLNQSLSREAGLREALEAQRVWTATGPASQEAKTRARVLLAKALDRPADSTIADLRGENERLKDADAFSRRELIRGNGIIDNLRDQLADWRTKAVATETELGALNEKYTALKAQLADARKDSLRLASSTTKLMRKLGTIEVLGEWEALDINAGSRRRERPIVDGIVSEVSTALAPFRAAIDQATQQPKGQNE